MSSSELLEVSPRRSLSPERHYGKYAREHAPSLVSASFRMSGARPSYVIKGTEGFPGPGSYRLPAPALMVTREELARQRVVTGRDGPRRTLKSATPQFHTRAAGSFYDSFGFESPSRVRLYTSSSSSAVHVGPSAVSRVPGRVLPPDWTKSIRIDEGLSSAPVLRTPGLPLTPGHASTPLEQHYSSHYSNLGQDGRSFTNHRHDEHGGHEEKWRHGGHEEKWRHGGHEEKWGQWRSSLKHLAHAHARCRGHERAAEMRRRHQEQRAKADAKAAERAVLVAQRTLKIRERITDLVSDLQLTLPPAQAAHFRGVAARASERELVAAEDTDEAWLRADLSHARHADVIKVGPARYACRDDAAEQLQASATRERHLVECMMNKDVGM